MRKIAPFMTGLLGICAAAALCASPAAAKTYSFSEGGFTDGATLSGTFTATDVDGDGAIYYQYGEPDEQDVTDFSLTFSGNSAHASFQLGFADLLAIGYDPLGVHNPAGFFGVIAGSDQNFIVSGIFGPCDGSAPCTIIGNPDGSIGDFSLEPFGVPEPATWIMMLLGFGLTGAALRASRRVGLQGGRAIA